MKNLFKFSAIYACLFFVLSACASSSPKITNRSPEIKKGQEVKSYEVILAADVKSIDIIRNKNKFEYKVCGLASQIVVNKEQKKETAVAFENAPLVAIGSIATLGILTPVLAPSLAKYEYQNTGGFIETMTPLDKEMCDFAPCSDADIFIRVVNSEKDNKRNKMITLNEKLNTSGEFEKEDAQLLKLFWEENNALPKGIKIFSDIQPDLETMIKGGEQRRSINTSELMVEIPKSKSFEIIYAGKDFLGLSQELLSLEIGNPEFKKAYIARFDDDFSKVLSKEPDDNSTFNDMLEFSKVSLGTRARLYDDETVIQKRKRIDLVFTHYEKGILKEVEQTLYNEILDKKKPSDIVLYRSLFNDSTLSNDMYVSLKSHFRKITDIEILNIGESLMDK